MEETINKKDKYRISKWIFFGISIFINAFIIFQSCLDGTTSSKWSNALSNIFENILNSGKGKIAPRIPVESLSISFLDTYQYNNVEGYENNQIPLGCTKLITASVLPKDASDSSITWSSSDDSIAYLNKQGKNLAITGSALGTFTITAKSNYDNKIKDTFTLEVVDLIEPTNFDIPESMDITLNGGDIVPVTIINDAMVLKTYDQDIFLPRYYDARKLTYTSSNPSIVDVETIQGVNNVLTAKSMGSAVISVSNNKGITKEITVNVTAEQPQQTLPDLDTITCYADDMDMARTDNTVGYQLNINNALYIPNDPLRVRISNDGRVLGFRKTTKNDINTSIKVIDKYNLSNFKTYNVVLTNPPLTDISLSITGANFIDGYYELEMGNSISVGITNTPSNAYGYTFTITSSNEKAATITSQGNSFYVNCLDEGICIITITCNENPSITKTFNVKVLKRGVINSDNREDFASFIRKSWGHFLLFTLSGVFTTLALYQMLNKYLKKWWISLLASLFTGIAIASLSELIQSLVPGRNGTFIDVAVDTLGYLIPLLVIGVIFFIIVLSKSKKQNKQ